MYLPYSYYPQPPLGLSVASLLLIDPSLLPNVMESFQSMRDVILGGDDYDEMWLGIGIVIMIMIIFKIIILKKYDNNNNDNDNDNNGNIIRLK